MTDEQDINRAANAVPYLDRIDHEELYGEIESAAGLLLARYRETDPITYGADE